MYSHLVSMTKYIFSWWYINLDIYYDYHISLNVHISKSINNMNTYSPSCFHFSHTGIYLLDMIYIDSAYPASDSIIETQQRTNQMNNILRVISDLQMSCTYGQFISSQSVRRIFSCEICREISDPRVYIHAHVWPSTSSSQITSWPSRMCRSTWCLFTTSRSFRSSWKMTISSK